MTGRAAGAGTAALLAVVLAVTAPATAQSSESGSGSASASGSAAGNVPFTFPEFTFVGTAAWFFLVLNLFKVPFSISLGLITPGTFGFSLKLVPFALLGALSGRWVISRMNQRAFETVALVLTLVAGVRLLM